MFVSLFVGLIEFLCFLVIGHVKPLGSMENWKIDSISHCLTQASGLHGKLENRFHIKPCGCIDWHLWLYLGNADLF